MKQFIYMTHLYIAGLIFLSGGILACDDETSESGDTDSGPKLPADVVSGATPGVSSIILGNEHEGRGENDCFSCHDTGHVHNYALGDCVTCHGRNGAPIRPAENDDLGCIGCHGDAHPGVSLPSNEACRACHENDNIKDECIYSETYDALVIGGGGGGLAAAAQIATAEKSVLLVEQSYKTGGCMVNFKRGEYRFEASLHAFDGWGMSYLGALGIKDALKPKRGDIMCEVAFPDMTLDVPADKTAYRDLLKTRFPDEAANIDKFFDNFGIAADEAQYDGLSLLEAVSLNGIKDRRLTYILTMLSGFLAETPDRLPAAEFMGMWDSYHSMGYYYFEGGSQAITDALERKIEDGGGIIKRHTRADKILVENNRVTGVHTLDGGCYTAKTVISDAGAKATFFNLVGKELLPNDLVTEVERRTPAASRLAMVFLGVDTDYSDLFPGGAHEIFVASDDRMTSEEINAVRCNPESVSYMLTNYSVADPTAAPEGKNAIVISADFMDYDCADQWNWGASYESYDAYKKDVARVLVERAEALLPGLSEHIEVQEVASPRTIEQFTLNEKGSWAGFAYEPDREHVYTDTTETPVDGLFMAGAWVGGSGQSVALSTGITAASAALEYLKQQ